MSFRHRGRLPVLALGLLLLLAACDSAEERAEKHFAAAMALLEAGDGDRAIIEFRNVFKLDAGHHDARLAFARLLRERGDPEASYGQYLRLVEQYPDDLDGRKALAELAIEREDWGEVTRHARAAGGIAPQDPEVVAVNALADYLGAVLKDPPDTDAAAAAVATARSVLGQPAAAAIARRVLIDADIRAGNHAAALDEIDRALAAEPDAIRLHEAKLQILALLRDQAGIGAHLQQMIARFPDNEQIGTTLVRWYMETGDLAGAEAYLRGRTADPDPEKARQARLAVVQFLRQSRSPGTVRAELDRLIAAGDADAPLYRSLRAAISFDAGDRAAAIAEMEAVVAGTAASDQANDFRIALARMYEATGNHADARARVEEVLAADPADVAALQMKAAWLIEEDAPGTAIGLLRTALAAEPRNPDTLTLMARAHLRDGSRELAGERLALAVEASDAGVVESLRYARFLIEDNRLPAAGTVLVSALSRAPTDIELLAALGDLYLRQHDWTRVEGVIGRLGDQGTPPATAVASGLRVALLAHQQKTDESHARLQRLIDAGTASTDAVAAVVRGQVERGEADAAEAYLDRLLTERPDDPRLRLLRGGIHALRGQTEAAETLYRALIAETPTAPEPVQALYALLRAAGRDTEAAAALDAGIEATGEAAPLLMIKAGALEQAGDFEAAIALYETLYARDSSNPALANNLASLITTHRDDAESLDRAFAISRRLRNTKVPQYQDTYGWIEARRGDPEAALSYLEPAARDLPGDPFVQLHLGLAYAALERGAQARAALTRALELADGSDLPQFARARDLLDSLPADD